MRTGPLEKRLPELLEIQSLAEKATAFGKVNIETEITRGHLSLPIYSFQFGTDDPQAPTMAYIAGVHGLERIGTRVLVAYMQTFCELLQWDSMLHHTLEKCRILFYPLANPGGMYARTRSTPEGIDMMRNAPVEAEGTSPLAIYAGQRFSPKLPWYRGKTGALGKEASTLCSFIQKHIAKSKVSLTLDIHSGFGAVDRLWFPYAKTSQPFPNLAEAYRIKELLDKTYPNHVYCVEPQSKQYKAHGDLWDYLYDEHISQNPENLFIPLSLEMGSWMWVKKNPKQLFNLLGVFNPILPHRRQRTLRRHITLFDFLYKATIAHQQWAHLNQSDRTKIHELALDYWSLKGRKKTA